MILSILTCALYERRELRIELEENLRRQLRGFSKVEWIIHEDNGEARYGEKMRDGMARCSGDYVVSVDDDDQVSEDYVEELLRAIQRRPDVVTFKSYRPDVQETWRFQAGRVDGQMAGDFRVMMANHNCAWRRCLAELVPWLPIQYGADVLWYRLANAAFFNLNQHHINKVLYHYLYRPEVTRCQREEDIHYSMTRVQGGIQGWRYQHRLYVSSVGVEHRLDDDSPLERVVGCDGIHQLIPRSEMEEVCLTILQ